MKKSRNQYIKIIAAMLAIVMVLPIDALAAQPETMEPLASAYLERYMGYISAMGSGNIVIGFAVTGNGILDSLGVKGITLYESSDQYDWFAVKVFYSSDYPNMMSTNDYFHLSTVKYQGKAGYYYQAHITFYGGNSTGGSTRLLWTPVKQAT